VHTTRTTTRSNALMKPLVTALLLAATLPVAAQPQGANQPPSPDMFMQMKDANQDGKVTLEEFQAPTSEQLKAMEQQFIYMDKNSDGALTADEVETVMQEMQQRMQQRMQQMQQRPGGNPHQR
jgi:hypothetical protein